MKNIVYIFLFLLCSSISFGQKFTGYTTSKEGVAINLSEGVLHINLLTDKSARIQYRIDNHKEEQDFVLINKFIVPKFSVKETADILTIKSKGIKVVFDKKTTRLTYFDGNDSLILSEKASSRTLKASTINGEKCFDTSLSFDSPTDELLFGLGQFQDGYYDLRNATRKLIQVNSQIAIPFMVSTKGYGLMWNQYGLTNFNPSKEYVALTKDLNSQGNNRELDVTSTSGNRRITENQSVYIGNFNIAKDGEYALMLDLGEMESQHLVLIDGVDVINQSNVWLPPAVSKLVNLKAGNHSVKIICKSTNTPTLGLRLSENETVFNSPHAKSLDYVIFAGNSTDEIIGQYRNLTGTVPMLPKWAYGYWQCRERYTSGDHLVSTVEEFRKRKLPVDVIVQDWQYWGKYGWGVPKFDETHYPEPKKFIKKLHDLDTHFSISVWENLNKESEIAKPYLDNNLFIPDSPWIDIYNPQTQTTHWDALNTNLFQLGVDSWWMDATEPENDALRGKKTYYGLGDFYRLTYPLFVSKAVYDGQRETDQSKRVAILTRSSFLGQQRYGTINWSGDIGWDWDAYRRQIVSGLNFSLTGSPFWTTDIGGFFRPGKAQYTDTNYHEILTRWFQWAVFNPIFRMHGYQSETEPWKYGDVVESNMREMMNLRYQLLPYIYSEAWQITKNNSTLMRPLIMDHNDDPAAVRQAYQYKFGKAFLVAPVIDAKVSQMPVYLPKNTSWYDFWTQQKYQGGQTVNANTPLDKLPIFVQAGSIVPMGKVIQSTKTAQNELEIRIYEGKDGSFTLFNDEGDNYNYEAGKFSEIDFTWNNNSRELVISKQLGSYENQPKELLFKIRLITDKQSNQGSKQITYTGKSIKLRL